jgi:hypothetical protein
LKKNSYINQLIARWKSKIMVKYHVSGERAPR